MRIWLALSLAAIATAAFGGSFEESLPAVPGLGEFAAQGAAAEKGLSSLSVEPRRFIVERTYLGSPAAFGRFLADKRAVAAFLGAPLTRFVADHGWAVERLAKPSVIDAVIGSPAMLDRALVSRLFTKTAIPLSLSRAEGVRQALGDRGFAERICTPAFRAWLADNPAAAAALKSQSPVLAEALKVR